MKMFKILTLFPELIEEFSQHSIIKKAIANQKISLEIINIRDFAENKHAQIDDYPYGGGAGMVLQALPVIKAIEHAKTNSQQAKVLLLSPQGQVWNQQTAYQFSREETDYILICGHYEGIDERIMSFVDAEISIGDYVLTGGEIPAMVIIDSVARLMTDVISNESHQNESFNNSLLDYPTYTRPEMVRGMKVPDVLLSGHHHNIDVYRKTQALINTYQKRPDLLAQRKLTIAEQTIINEYQNSNQSKKLPKGAKNAK